ncbi:MAG: hypothetical protein K5989_03210 [Lachnospiraceae bacterium]|nr:hypothetical protein [Lachnospiraceae bacterium]
MSRFDVKPKFLMSQASSLEEDAKQLGQFGNEVIGIKDSLDFSADLNNVIGFSLQIISKELLEESRGCRNLSLALSNAVGKYDAAEENICGKAQVTWSKASGTGSFLQNVVNHFGEAAEETLLAAMGPFGKLVGSTKDLTEGKPGDAIGNLLELVGDVVKNTDGSKINWAGLLGMDVIKKGGIWKHSLSKYFDFSTVRNGLSSACNWLSAGVVSGFNNYNEFGNFGSRFWEETAVETGLLVGEGVLMTAAAGGALLAMGFSAPALAVGAAAAGLTVLVDWGLDSLVTACTGGAQTSWMEWASDGICDTAESVGNWMKDTGEKIGNAVSEGVGKAVNGIQSLAGSLCNWGKVTFGWA